mmetsp:Transcript_15783/g.34155  ORF Transcript_15783/g.34155 Transcript_15783/m.34155 type:complete len:257 (+) Transcript_15783:2699-3469(+)
MLAPTSGITGAVIVVSHSLLLLLEGVGIAGAGATTASAVGRLMKGLVLIILILNATAAVPTITSSPIVGTVPRTRRLLLLILVAKGPIRRLILLMLLLPASVGRRLMRVLRPSVAVAPGSVPLLLRSGLMALITTAVRTLLLVLLHLLRRRRRRRRKRRRTLTRRLRLPVARMLIVPLLLVLLRWRLLRPSTIAAPPPAITASDSGVGIVGAIVATPTNAALLLLLTPLMIVRLALMIVTARLLLLRLWLLLRLLW